MNEKQARDRGYSFTGVYNFAKEDSVARLDQIKANRYKAILVYIPTSKYSRGGGSGGYSVYAEAKYFNDIERCDLQVRVAGIPYQREKALDDYQAVLKKIYNNENRFNARLGELGTKEALK